MYTGFTHLHSSLRYLILVGLVTAIAMAFSKKNEAPSKGQISISKITFILTHVQLLVGLALYFMSPHVKAMFGDSSLIGANEQVRFFGIEHGLAMILAIAMITVGWIRFKKSEGAAKQKMILRFWGMALIIIFVMIPWPFLRDFGTWF